MPSAAHGNSVGGGKGPPSRPVKSSGWVDDPNASPIHLKAQKPKKEPPIPLPRVAIHKSNQLLSVGGEWALKECEEHTTWVNEILKQQDYRPIEDLRRGVSDGVTLVHVTEILCNERPTGIHGLPVLKSHKIQNVIHCLNLFQSKGVEVDDLKPEELVEGNLKSTLTLMKNLRAKFDYKPFDTPGSNHQSSPSSYSPQSSATPHQWTENKKAMPGAELVNGGLDMLPGIMGVKEEGTSQPTLPVPKMSTTEMDVHGVLQHQHLTPPYGRTPETQSTNRSTPARGGGQTPIGYTPNQLSLPNSMTVEEKLRSLLTNNNYQDENHGYDDGELLLPPPPKDRSESFEDDVFDNNGFSSDRSPDMTVRSARRMSADANVGYVPSKPGERRYGPRGEVILDRYQRPPPPYRPRSTSQNQSPPRQQQGPGSPKKGKSPMALRDACSRMYGAPPGPPQHQRQPPPYISPADNRPGCPSVPPRNSTGQSSSTSSYGTPHQHTNNQRPSVPPRVGQPMIYAVPHNRTQAQEDIAPNHEQFKRNSLQEAEHMDPNGRQGGRVTFDLKTQDSQGQGQPMNGQMVENNLRESRPLGTEGIVIKVDSVGPHEPRRERSPQQSPNAPRTDSLRVQNDGVSHNDSFRTQNTPHHESFRTQNIPHGESYRTQNVPHGESLRTNVAPEESGTQNTDRLRGDSFRIQETDIHREASLRIQGEGGTHNESFRTQNDHRTREDNTHQEMVPMQTMNRDSSPNNRQNVGPGPSYKVGHIVDNKPLLDVYFRGNNDPRTNEELNTSKHNSSSDYVKMKDLSFERTDTQFQKNERGQNRDSLNDGRTYTNMGFEDDRLAERTEGPNVRNFVSGAQFHANQKDFHQPDREHFYPNHENFRPDRIHYYGPEERTSFDNSSTLSSDNLPKLGDPFHDAEFDDGVPNIQDFEFSGSDFSSRSVTPPLPPLSPSNTPPMTPPFVQSPRGGLGPPRTKILSPRQGDPSLRYLQGARKTPDLLSNMEKFSQEVFIDGPGVNDQISITPPGSPHGKYKVWNNPYPPGRISLPSPKTRRKKRTPKSGGKAGHRVSFKVDGSDSDSSDQRSSASGEPGTAPGNLGNTSFNANANTQEISLIRKQLDGLEMMYQEILKILGVERDYIPPGQGTPEGTKGKSKLKSHKKHSSKEIRNISKRFARLESHVVTLARSVAHLSSEMRSQNMIYQDLEALKQEVRILKDQGGLAGHRYGANEWERFRGWVPSLTNPKRVDKLKRFFGQEPPLLRLFLKKLGYEKYATNFDTEHISMVELPYMTEQRLQSIGIPMGPRLRILQEAQLCFRQENFNIYIV